MHPFHRTSIEWQSTSASANPPIRDSFNSCNNHDIFDEQYLVQAGIKHHLGEDSCEIAEFVDFERWQYAREFRESLRVRGDCAFKILVFEILKS